MSDTLELLRERQEKYERLIETGEWTWGKGLLISTRDLRALIAVAEAAREYINYPLGRSYPETKTQARLIAALAALDSGETQE